MPFLSMTENARRFQGRGSHNIGATEQSANYYAASTPTLDVIL
jgi:hypothetical protein